MNLPSLNTPEYSIFLPLSEQNVSFRPFLVKEEKIILMEMESLRQENEQGNVEASTGKAILKSMAKVVASCTLSDIDVRRLPLTDLGLLFLNIRKKSVGETVDVGISKIDCDQSECKFPKKLQIDLADIGIVSRDKNIQLTNDIWLEMEYPTLDNSENFIGVSKIEDIFKLIASCIYKIYTNENVIAKSEISEEELVEWIEGFTEEQFQKVSEFIKNPPTLEYSTTVKCQCGKEKEVSFKGLNDFFS